MTTSTGHFRRFFQCFCELFEVGGLILALHAAGNPVRDQLHRRYPHGGLGGWEFEFINDQEHRTYLPASIN